MKIDSGLDSRLRGNDIWGVATLDSEIYIPFFNDTEKVTIVAALM